MGNDRFEPEGKAKYKVVADMRTFRRMGQRIGWMRVQMMPHLMEIMGISMIISGLWVLSPVASVIALGIVLVVIAQGLATGRDKP